MTRPFICRADDGYLYYVKGSGAGRRALIAETLAAPIGRALGLPVPEAAPAFVPKELIAQSVRGDIYQLGSEFVFASRAEPHVKEFALAQLPYIPTDLQARVLLFDYWIQNGDRSLTEHGGNPNLLWSHGTQTLSVIDHNLAFESAGTDEMWEHHVFRHARSQWDRAFKERLTPVMDAILDRIPEYWRALPEAWTEVDTGLSLTYVQSVLGRFKSNPAAFWAGS